MGILSDWEEERIDLLESWLSQLLATCEKAPVTKLGEYDGKGIFLSLDTIYQMKEALSGKGTVQRMLV